jgi:hypothetical protein
MEANAEQVGRMGDSKDLSPTCEGPCMPWCSVGGAAERMAASATVAYATACALYYVRTRGVGTPFLDSLTEEQREIYAESARVRGRIFCESALVGVALAVAMRTMA